MLKLENSIRGLSFSRVAFDLTIQAKNFLPTPSLTEGLVMPLRRTTKYREASLILG